MKPFNLEAAERGDKLVTRDGREVSEFVHLKTESSDSPCVVVIGGSPYWFSKDGVVHGGRGQDSPADLFMAPTKRTVYANLYAVPNKAGDRSPCHHAVWHDTEEDARKAAGLGALAVAAPVVIEE